MTELLPVTVLINARQQISNMDSWTRNSYARDSQGEPVNENDATAVCFCSLGALRKVTPDSEFNAYTNARRALMETLDLRGESVKAPCRNVPGFNDHPETTHADVLALFDDTIKRLSE